MRIAEVLKQSDDLYGTSGNRVSYLATPPQLFGTVARNLGTSGLSEAPGDGFSRLVLEKPFGWDEESARALYGEITPALAKETVQNLVALRFANSIFEPMWNRTWVDNVQITVAETLGVEGRGSFYDTTGAGHRAEPCVAGPVPTPDGSAVPCTYGLAMEFGRPPQLPLFPSGEGIKPDTLIIRVQPDDGLSLQFGAKVPGHAFHIRQASMDFRYSTGSDGPGAEAYGRGLLDALVGDPTLFVRADEVSRAWKIVDPLLAFWAQSPDPIPLYQAASWGPREANELLTRDGRAWRSSG